MDNVIQKGLLVTVAHHGWKEKEKEDGGWRGSMKREHEEGGWQREHCRKVAECSGGSNRRGVRVNFFV